MIKLDKLCLKLPHFALEDISLEIESGDYFMLVGPTGSGKTLLLETIAGLRSINSGSIWVDNEDITLLPPERRHVAIVYQDSALFPHISVAENIAFGLRMRRTKGSNIKRKLKEMAGLVGVEQLLERKPVNLSGGEKQKVALARSLIIGPKVLLLDEPLAAIDAETRSGLQAELKRVHKELGVTIIHVTHDFEETLSTGKHAAVIRSGRIQQVGTPEQIFRKPESEFVAHFTMMRNVFAGHLDGQSVFSTGAMRLNTRSKTENVNHACIRPDDVTISFEAQPDESNSFRGIVTRIDDRGQMFYVTVNVPPEVSCMLTRNTFAGMGLELGMPISVILKREAIHLF